MRTTKKALLKELTNNRECEVKELNQTQKYTTFIHGKIQPPKDTSFP